MQHQLDRPESEPGPEQTEIVSASRFLAAERYALRLSSRLILRFSLDVRRVLSLEIDVSDIVYL